MTENTERVLVIGNGYAGSRFIQALDYLIKKMPNRFSINGVCDIDSQVEMKSPLSVPFFTNLTDALNYTNPTIIAVTVNESSHYDVLRQLPLNNSILILCEKPLTRTLSEAKKLAGFFNKSFLSINFVERHSPVIQHYFDWRRNYPDLKTSRVEFFWGKCRVYDPRPTMGVMSDISHPLDLVDYIFGYSDWSIDKLSGRASDFSPHGDKILDSLDFILHTESYPLFCHSSFVWPKRRRNITGYLSNGHNRFFQVNFDFDNPTWDCDSLEIVSIDTDKRIRETLVEIHYNTADFPSELPGIYKVNEYIHKSYLNFRGIEIHPELVGYDQGLKIQEVLNQIHVELFEANSILTYGFLKNINVSKFIAP